MGKKGGKKRKKEKKKKKEKESEEDETGHSGTNLKWKGGASKRWDNKFRGMLSVGNHFQGSLQHRPPWEKCTGSTDHRGGGSSPVSGCVQARRKTGTPTLTTTPANRTVPEFRASLFPDGSRETHLLKKGGN